MDNSLNKITLHEDTKEKKESFEELYNFIRASLIALQATNGFGEADFVCPVCSQTAHIKREKRTLYNKTEISCPCGYSFHC